MAFKSRLKCLFLKPIFCILFATFLHFARNTTTAGYDFEKIKPTVEPKTDSKKGVITIQLPDTKILTSGMLSDKEEVYYEKESIFNNLSEENKAELRAEMGDKAENIAVENGLLDKAKSNAKKVLKNFIYNIYDSNDYDIVFEDEKE